MSGLSAARDVLAESFSFSGRGTVFGESSAREKELNSRVARQDSATLPKDPVWEGAVRSPSISRRSSSQSMKKRKRDAPVGDLRTLGASASSLRRAQKDDGDDEVNFALVPKEQQIAPPRSDSIRMHSRNGLVLKGALPPGLTPSAQKLDQGDQAALHRISLIMESDREISTASLSPPVSGSTSASLSGRMKMDSRSKVNALGSPFKIPSALSSPSTYSQYTTSPFASPGKLSVPRSAGGRSNKSGKNDDGYESFLEDFDVIGPSSGSSRGGNSGYAGSGDSSFRAQVPKAITSPAFSPNTKLPSATGLTGFSRDSPKFAHAGQSTNFNLQHQRSPSGSSCYSQSVDGASLHSARHQSPRALGRKRSRRRSPSSIIANVGRSPEVNFNTQGL